MNTLRLATSLALVLGSAPLLAQTSSYVQQDKITVLNRSGLGAASALDRSTLVLGAPYTAVDGHAFVGSVSVFDLNASTRTPIAEFYPHGTSAAPLFGYSVAISGGHIAVGLLDDDTLANGCGSVFTYELRNGVWTEESHLLPPDVQLGASFGRTLALSGDTLIVGARGVDGPLSQSGAAYVYVHGPTGWTLQQKLFPSDPAPDGKFGWSVALQGNLAAVSAIDAYESGQRSGAVYLFWRNGLAWTQIARFADSKLPANVQLGWSLALDGGVLVAGAIDQSGSSTFAGAAYVWRESLGHWYPDAILRARDMDADDLFGSSVAVRGSRIVVGAPTDDDIGFMSGAVVAYQRIGGAWTQGPRIESSDLGASDNFGASFALDRTRLIVGAPGASSAGQSPGAGYLFVWQ